MKTYIENEASSKKGQWVFLSRLNQFQQENTVKVILCPIKMVGQVFVVKHYFQW